MLLVATGPLPSRKAGRCVHAVRAYTTLQRNERTVQVVGRNLSSDGNDPVWLSTCPFFPAQDFRAQDQDQ